VDNLAHSLVGALIGQAGLKRKTGLAMPALIIGANLPDIDAACLLWLDGVEHLGFRRGITHGPPAWVLLPLVLAGLLWGFDKWQAKRGKRPEGRLPVSFKWLYLLGFIACLTHPAMDWLNVYGIRLLEPFSSQWFYGDVLFIIDIWLWLGLGFATWLSLRREKRGGNWQRPARFGLAGLLIYIVVNWHISVGYTLVLSQRPGATMIASPLPFLFWQRELIQGGKGFYWIDDRKVGEFELTPEDYPAIIAAVPQAAPFVFWSRTPYIERDDNGIFYLRDARFAWRPGGGFRVRLPEAVCKPLNPAPAAQTD